MFPYSRGIESYGAGSTLLDINMHMHLDMGMDTDTDMVAVKVTVAVIIKFMVKATVIIIREIRESLVSKHFHINMKQSSLIFYIITCIKCLIFGTKVISIHPSRPLSIPIPPSIPPPIQMT